MTIEEEAWATQEVKTLSGYRRSRDLLEQELGRRATAKEWAAFIGISVEELSRQVRSEALSTRGVVKNVISHALCYLSCSTPAVYNRMVNR